MNIGGNITDVAARFPNLSDQAAITSPETPRYNCIAYAAGDETRWWWPDPTGLAYWPPGCKRLETLASFQIAFEKLGFALCANGALEEGIEKVAIFHRNNKPTHAAKQLENGSWSSKLGKWFDISHTENCLNGVSYGQIAFFMQRQR